MKIHQFVQEFPQIEGVKSIILRQTLTRFFKVTLLGPTHKWPFQGLSDLHLGNQKVTLKKLVYRFAWDGWQKKQTYFYMTINDDLRGVIYHNGKGSQDHRP